MKAVRRQHRDCPTEQRSEVNVRQTLTDRVADKFPKIEIIDGADQMRQHAHQPPGDGIGICRRGQPIGDKARRIERAKLRSDRCPATKNYVR